MLSQLTKGQKQQCEMSTPSGKEIPGWDNLGEDGESHRLSVRSLIGDLAALADRHFKGSWREESEIDDVTTFGALRFQIPHLITALTMTIMAARSGAMHMLAFCMSMVLLLRPAVSLARSSFLSRTTFSRQWSKTALDMVRNRGLEVRREGATPTGERMQSPINLMLIQPFPS